MKTIQKKDAIRNIRKRIVSYLSVCLVIMLGLGGAFITRYMGAAINAEATRYYNAHGFKNYEMISSLGVTEADIAQIAETEGVIDAEGVIRTGGALSKGDMTCSVDLISMTERISVPEVIEGRAPAASDECMISEDLAEVKGLKVGDKVKLVMSGSNIDEDSSDPEKRALYETGFTITGLMKHPDYLRRKSTDSVVLPWAAYNLDYLGDFYSHVFVKTEEPEGTDIFSDKYFREMSGTKQRLEELAESLEVDSLARVKEKTYKTLDERWQEALDELEEGQKEIDENEAKLNAELDDALKDLRDAQAELNDKVADAKKRIASAEKKIAAGAKKIRNNEKKIKAGEKTLKDYKEKLKLIDEKLPEAKKYIEDLRTTYGEDLKNSLEDLAQAQRWLDILSKFDQDTEEYAEALENLANFIVQKQDAIKKVHEFCGRSDAMEIAQKLKEVTDIDATGVIAAIRDYNVDSMIELAERVSDGGAGAIEAFIEETKEWIDYLRDYLKKLDEYESYIEKYEKNRAGYYDRIRQKEKELEKGKEKLKSAKKELAAAKKELASKKAQLKSERSKYQAEIDDGWNLYYRQKDNYEQKLQEAKDLLAENREEAEKKFADLRAEVENMECAWLVLDRRANAGYVDVRSNIGAIRSASLIFGIMFMLISAIVCFSTLSIIIEEQKKMVGTVKAFGFHKGEILGKYLTFGVSSALIGCAAGVLAALGLSGAVLRAYYNSGMYQFDMPKSIVTPGITILFCLIMIAICAAATVVACFDILKSPASILMKGGTAKKAVKKKSEGSGKTNAAAKSKSLYSRLIVRNMIDDKVRVIISIVIIAFSTLLVGTGISMKLAFDGMPEKQVGEIYKYDVRVDLSDDLDEKERAGIEKIMSEAGADYTQASYTSHVIRIDDRLDAVNVLSGDADSLGDFFTVVDAKTGNALELPEDGVLAQKKMKESYGMGEGSTITVYNDDLHECSADVKGVFQNYVGRTMITSSEGYMKVFGGSAPANCYLVKLNGADLETFEKTLLAANDDISFEAAAEFVKKFETASLLYNLIVIVTTGIAILMSLMILSNLANIFLNRKKTELTVMRINGFSIKQTKGYLIRETVITTIVGVVLGVLAGAISDPFIIRAMEQPDLQFVRSFHVLAWVAAVAIEALFAIVIYSAVFRKVKDLNFRDVQ